MPDTDDLKLVVREAIPDNKACARNPDLLDVPFRDEFAGAGVVRKGRLEEIIAATLSPAAATRASRSMK